ESTNTVAMRPRDRLRYFTGLRESMNRVGMKAGAVPGIPEARVSERMIAQGSRESSSLMPDSACSSRLGGVLFPLLLLALSWLALLAGLRTLNVLRSLRRLLFRLLVAVRLVRLLVHLVTIFHLLCLPVDKVAFFEGLDGRTNRSSASC